jgi:hypothetical protein
VYCERTGAEISFGRVAGGYLRSYGHTLPAVNLEVLNMAMASIHACDCSNGFTYVGEISISKKTGLGGAPVKEELAVSNYFVISTKMLIDRTWTKETGEDNKEHLKYVPFSTIVSLLYGKLRDQGTLNKKQVKLPNVNANHELDV